MTHGVQRVISIAYLLGYGLPFVLVFLNFGLTVLYLDRLQDPNDPEGLNFLFVYYDVELM